MSNGLTVFIDEGGDSGTREGLRFQHTRHEWFSIAAYVVRNTIEPQTVAWRDELMRAGNVRQSPVLHYYKLKPDRRVQVAELLGTKSARALCLLSHKENMRAYYNAVLGKFDAIKFYNWCSRLLLERVIELAELDAKKRGVQPEPLRIIFSENRGHDYEGMFDYFENKLNYQADRGGFILKPKSWKSALMKPELWTVEPHDELAGLQLADVIASAFLQGANSNATNHDIRPALGLSGIMARGRNGERANSGVTLWPLAHQGPIPLSARPMFERFGYVFG